jgi:hypothetical protein
MTDGNAPVARGYPVTEGANWILHRQPDDQIIDHKFSIWSGEHPVVLANEMPGEEGALAYIVSSLNAQAAPITHRWRSFGAHTWIYDPEPEWLEDHKFEVEWEPVYGAPQPASVAQGVVGCSSLTFGVVVENIAASDRNPIKRGIFIRKTSAKMAEYATKEGFHSTPLDNLRVASTVSSTHRSSPAATIGCPKMQTGADGSHWCCNRPSVSSTGSGGAA